MFTHCGNFVIFRPQTPFLVLMNFFLGMQAACRNNPDDPEALKALDVLFETAMISSGFSVGTVSC